jgi:hypothetical protein
MMLKGMGPDVAFMIGNNPASSLGPIEHRDWTTTDMDAENPNG